MYSHSPVAKESPLVPATFKLGWKKIPQKKKGWRKIFGAETPLLNLELLAEIYLKLAAGNLCSFIHVEDSGWQYWFPLSSSSMQLVTFQNRKTLTLSGWLLPASRNTAADWTCHLHVGMLGGYIFRVLLTSPGRAPAVLHIFRKIVRALKSLNIWGFLLIHFATAQMLPHLSLYSSFPP